MSYTDVFGSNTVPPSGSSYSKEEFEGTVQGYWPEFVAETGIAVSSILELFSTSVATIKMPPASQVSVGRDVLILNNGLATITIRDYDNGLIGTLTTGQSRYVFVKENDDEAGLWGTVMYGVGTAYTDAAILDGYGLTAVNTELVQSKTVVPLTVPNTVEQAHRAAMVAVTGGTGALTLPPAATMADGFFTTVHNNGSGIVTVTPSGAETINGEDELDILNNGFLTLVSTGSVWKAFGFQNTEDTGTPSFGTIVVSGQDSLVAETVNDSLQIVSGTNITVTTNLLNSTVTITGDTQLPDQTSNSGKFLTTDGTIASWGTVSGLLPSQTGNTGKTLITNGTSASWGRSPAIHVSTTPVADDGVIISGTYTPTFVSSYNCVSHPSVGSSGLFTFQRVGRRVSVTGSVLFNAPSTGYSAFTSTVPIPISLNPDFSPAGVISGVVNNIGVNGSVSRFSYNSSSVSCRISIPTGTSATDGTIFISFSYLADE